MIALLNLGSDIRMAASMTADVHEFSSLEAILMNRIGYVEVLLGATNHNDIRVMSKVRSARGSADSPSNAGEGSARSRGLLAPGIHRGLSPLWSPPALTTLHTILETLLRGDPWTMHVRDVGGWRMTARAISLGGYVSIGLGDVPYRRLGQLVRRVAHLAETMGHPVATIE
ncbi:3-keto-5-aminohexanoate cleavage protein [Paenarthrobacter sp. NyZ202]|uniref:3-keto-5-aminohexanoate cleavage protein n=1 Tax=Paenarthrobacter sp. NyZ202 TaxID=3402689 RepID=UPI003CEFDF4B